MIPVQAQPPSGVNQIFTDGSPHSTFYSPLIVSSSLTLLLLGFTWWTTLAELHPNHLISSVVFCCEVQGFPQTEAARHRAPPHSSLILLEAEQKLRFLTFLLEKQHSRSVSADFHQQSRISLVREDKVCIFCSWICFWLTGGGEGFHSGCGGCWKWLHNNQDWT